MPTNAVTNQVLTTGPIDQRPRGAVARLGRSGRYVSRYRQP